MTKADMISLVQKEVEAFRNAGRSHHASAEGIVDALSREIREALKKGDSVKFYGLGTLRVIPRAARTGRNPRTGETVAIPAKRAVKFTAGTELKKALQ